MNGLPDVGPETAPLFHVTPGLEAPEATREVSKSSLGVKIAILKEYKDHRAKYGDEASSPELTERWRRANRAA
jgi:hypothetical protein